MSTLQVGIGLTQKSYLQCESITAGLKAPPAQSRRDELTNGSAASKLGAAVRAENDQRISSEQEKQQLLLRSVLPFHLALLPAHFKNSPFFTE